MALKKLAMDKTFKKKKHEKEQKEKSTKSGGRDKGRVVEVDAATMEDAAVERTPNAQDIQMEITFERITASTQEIETILTLSKEEDTTKAEAMADAVALVDLADPHQEKHTINNSMEGPLNW